MIKQIFETHSDSLTYICAVCVTDNAGGKIALSIIVLSLVLLGIINWARKKYFANKNQISQQK